MQCLMQTHGSTDKQRGKYMKKELVKRIKALVQDESAQGATEYILLLVVIVALMGIFKDKIISAVTGKVNDVGSKIGGFN